MSNAALPKILLLEDEVNVGSTLCDRLSHEGYEVVWAKTLADAKAAIPATQPSFSLALLDVNLPDGSGFDVARIIRTVRPATAIVFLTAAGTPEDRIHGLELGAEDYVVKPFHFKELLLRIQNVLKRANFVGSSAAPNTQVRIGRASVSFQEYQLSLDGTRHPLSHKECTLLKLLYEKRGQVVSRDEILNLVWSEEEYPTPRTIDNFILKLRKFIEPDPENPVHIRSVRGVGYLLEKESL